VYAVSFAKRCGEIIEPKLDDTPCGFVRAVALHTKSSLSNKFSRKLGRMPMTSATCFVVLEKTYDRVPCEKLWEVLREYGVSGRLLLAVKSLYSCSKVCFCVGELISTVRSGCWNPTRVSVLSPLLFIVYINWIYSSRRGCHCWKLQDQLFAFCGRFGSACSFWTGFQQALDRFSVACEKSGMKTSTKKQKYYVSPDTQVNARCKSAVTLQQVQISSTLGWYSRVTEQGDWYTDG